MSTRTFRVVILLPHCKHRGQLFSPNSVQRSRGYGALLCKLFFSDESQVVGFHEGKRSGLANHPSIKLSFSGQWKRGYRFLEDPVLQVGLPEWCSFCHTARNQWDVEYRACGFSTLGILAPCFSQAVGDTSRFYSFLSLSLLFLIGGERGSINTNHLIIKKCHFSAFQMRKKKKGEMGRGKTSTSWQIF